MLVLGACRPTADKFVISCLAYLFHRAIYEGRQSRTEIVPRWRRLYTTHKFIRHPRVLALPQAIHEMSDKCWATEWERRPFAGKMRQTVVAKVASCLRVV